MRLVPSTPGDYVRARVLVPRNPGVTPFNHGPVKRVRARKFNYQVNLFLVVEANHSLNEVLVGDLRRPKVLKNRI